MYPKRELNIPLILFSPGRRLASIGFTCVNKPSTLALALQTLSKHNLNVLGIISDAAHAEMVVISNSVIVDFTESSEEELRRAVEELGRLDVVGDVKFYVSDVLGLASEKYHDFYKLLGERSILVSVDILASLLRKLLDVFGESTANAFRYHLGAEVGSEMAKRHIRVFKDVKTCIKVIEEEFHAVGYAYEASFRQVSEREYEAAFEGLVECDALRPLGHGPTAYLAPGLLAGYISTLLGGEWEAREEKCVNAGSDVCVVSIKRKD